MSKTEYTENDSPREQLEKVISDPERAPSFLVFNANRLSDPAAINNWEKHEPGCMEGMQRAHKNAISSIDQELSIDVINNMHRELFTDTKQYGNLEAQKDINAMDVPFRSFGLPSAITQDEVAGISKDITKLRDKLNLNDTDPAPYTIDRNPKSGNYQISGADISVTKEYTTKLIERYNTAQKTATDQDTKLDNIVELVQSLERIHPYPDFNCRTFCVALLDRELVKNGFSAVALEDPNQFDFKNKDELKKIVHEGQENFQRLVKTGRVHEQDPSLKEQYMNIDMNESNGKQIANTFDKITEGKYTTLAEERDNKYQKIGEEKDLARKASGQQEFATSEIFESPPKAGDGKSNKGGSDVAKMDDIPGPFVLGEQQPVLAEQPNSNAHRGNETQVTQHDSKKPTEQETQYDQILSSSGLSQQMSKVCALNGIVHNATQTPQKNSLSSSPTAPGRGADKSPQSRL